MSTIFKQYKFRLCPTRDQATLLKSFSNARRFVWNWGLARRLEYYSCHKKTLSCFSLIKELVQFKSTEEGSWLNKIPSQSLQQALMDLDRAYGNFFKRKTTKMRFPKFKSKKLDRLRFRIPQHLRIDDEKLIVPKLGKLRLKGFRDRRQN